MKVTEKYLDAVRDQVAYLLEDTYEVHNKRVREQEKTVFQELMAQYTGLTEFTRDGSSQYVQNSRQRDVEEFIKKKHPARFAAIPKEKSLYNLKEAIRRDAVLISGDAKSTDEILTRLTAKYTVS